MASFQGKARLRDHTGAELGSLRVRYEKPLKAGETAEIAETVYPVVFSGSFDKLRSAEADKIQVRFEPETIEFVDGSKLSRE